MGSGGGSRSGYKTCSQKNGDSSTGIHDGYIIYTYLHFDVELSITLFDVFSYDLDGCVQLCNALCSVQRGSCHHILRRGY